MPSKILYLHHGGSVGGAPLSLLFLLQQLDRTRYQPTVLFTRPGPVIDRYRAAGIDVHIEPGITDFSHTELVWYGRELWWQFPGHLLQLLPSIAAMRRQINALRPDLIHLNTSALVAGAIAARQAGIPMVWHIREPLAAGYFGWRRAWLRQQIAQAQRIIAISHFDAQQLVPTGQPLLPQTRVIYNFVDFAQFNRTLNGATVRQKLGIAPERPIILMLGGSSLPKGTLPLVQAAPELHRHFPQALILIAGRKPHVGASQPLNAALRVLSGVDAYDRSVLQAASQPIAAGYLRFLGVRSDVPELLAAADVLVFPAVVPHFARPIIEASAMGKPVVASDLGGAQELVKVGETGLLVPPNDPPALTHALLQLLRDHPAAAQMGENGYHLAQAQFNAQYNAERTFAVYQELGF